MTVAMVMTKDLVVIPSGTKVRDAARVLVEKVISGAPVVDADGKVIGVVSEKDLFRSLYPSEQEFSAEPELLTDADALENRANEAAERVVDELMSTQLIAVTPSTPLVRAGALMLAKHVHRVLVMEAGQLKGIVSRHDVYKALFGQVVEPHA